MMPSKMQILVAPCLLIPTQTWTLSGCFGLRLSLRWFADLSVTGAPVLFKGDGTFVAENYVVETVVALHNSLGVLKPFNLVGVSDQLAIRSALQGPSLLDPRSPNCGGVDHNSALS